MAFVLVLQPRKIIHKVAFSDPPPAAWCVLNTGIEKINIGDPSECPQPGQSLLGSSPPDHPFLGANTAKEENQHRQ